MITLIQKLEREKYDPSADMELPYNSHQAAYNASLVIFVSQIFVKGPHDEL